MSNTVDYTIMRLGKVVTSWHGKAHTIIVRCPVCGLRGEGGVRFFRNGEWPRVAEYGSKDQPAYWPVTVRHIEKRIDVAGMIAREPIEECEFDFPGMKTINASIRETNRANKKARKIQRQSFRGVHSDWPAEPYDGLVGNEVY